MNGTATCGNEMLFADIRKRTDPLHIKSKGLWEHDMGVKVFTGMDLIAKLSADLQREELATVINERLEEMNGK